MFRFENIDYLNFLAIIPVLILIYIAVRYFRKRAFKNFGDLSLIQQLMPQVSKYKHTFKFVLLMLAFIFSIIALSNKGQH